MAQHLDLEARLSTVEHALADITGRLRALERGLPARPVAAAEEVSTPAPDAAIASTDLVGTFTLIGRTFVIFAGGYLLRALTESGTLDRSTGAMFGVAYAAAWTVVAYRVAPRHALSATFFGACTVLIGFPLLWEATTRFALLTPAAGALALGATTAVVLVTAWRRHLHALAWLATIGACALASLLLVMTGGALPFASFLIALGVATLWLGYDCEWTMLRWVAAFFADIAVLGLVGRALATPPRDPPSRVMAVQWLLLAGYLGSIAIRTLVRGRDVLPFEAVQTGAMLLAGLGGAMLIAHQTGSGALMLGPAVLALAMACYAVAFVDRRQARGANFHFFTSLALVFALTGSEFVLDGAALAILWVLLALVAAWAARRSARSTLAVHAIVYLAAAAVSSGLVTTTLAGLFASVDTAWSPVGAAAWAVLVATALCWLLSTPKPGSASSRVTNASRLVLALLALVSVVGVCVVVIRSLLPPDAAVPLHAGLVATLRTGVLAAAAIIVAWLGRRLVRANSGRCCIPCLAGAH